MDVGTTGISQINSLIRGEISAAETYRKGIDAIKSGSQSATSGDVALLEQILKDHGFAANELHKRVTALGGEPDKSSGPWGAFANTVQMTANLLGDAASLKSLKEGEEHGLKDYEEAVDDVDPETANMMRTQFIPAQQEHIRILDRLMSQLST